MQKEGKKIVIGIDQSYTRTGYAVCVDGKIEEHGSLSPLNKEETHIRLRARLKLCVSNIINKYLTKYTNPDIMIITERDNSKHRLVIKNSAELTSLIADVAYFRNIPTYSVVATAWKSKVIPKKYGKPSDYETERKPNKMPQIMFCEKELGIDLKEYDKKGNIKLDKEGRMWYIDDIADAVGIALYGFVDSKLQKLQKEE